MVLYLLRLLLRLFNSYDKTVKYTILLHWYQILDLENGFISFYKQDNGRLERKTDFPEEVEWRWGYSLFVVVQNFIPEIKWNLYSDQSI